MKTYHYTYSSKPQDLVALGLDHTYHQYTGLINIVFTIAMLILLIARWNAWGILGNIFLVVALMIFPVFQPLAMYLHGRKVIGPKPSEMDMTIGEDAMRIRSEGKQTTIQWERITGIYFSKGILVLYPDANHGYILTKRIVGEELQEVTDYCKARIEATHPKKTASA